MQTGTQPGGESDITVLAAQARFHAVALEPPFVISGRPMPHVTAVTAHVEVRTRDGRTVGGIGAGMLSVPWFLADLRTRPGSRTP